jgi:hypothetical protein
VTVRRAAQVHDALTRKGMVADDGTHHVMLKLTVDGHATAVTRISHGTREIDEGLGKLMARQCYLQLREFWDLVDCPMSAEAWVAKVKERAQGGRNPFIGR